MTEDNVSPQDHTTSNVIKVDQSPLSGPLPMLVQRWSHGSVERGRLSRSHERRRPRGAAGHEHLRCGSFVSE